MKNIQTILVCVAFSSCTFTKSEKENPYVGTYRNGTLKLVLRADSTYTKYILDGYDLSGVNLETDDPNKPVPERWKEDYSAKWNVKGEIITINRDYRWTGRGFCFNDPNNNFNEICFKRTSD